MKDMAPRIRSLGRKKTLMDKLERGEPLSEEELDALVGGGLKF